jgi:hypothetical protein
VVRGSKKALDELPPPQVAEEVFRVVPGVEIPLFPFPVLMTEIAHNSILDQS